MRKPEYLPVFFIIFNNFISWCYAANLAMGKYSQQSSTLSEAGVRIYSAEKAMDGITDFVIGSVTCAHTDVNGDKNPWWAVDLGNTYAVYHIVLYGRTDFCCVFRFGKFAVDVIMENQCACDKWATFHGGSTKTCHYQDAATTFVNITCPQNTVGRFVRIMKDDREPLTICEIEIYGEVYKNLESKQTIVSGACGYEGKAYNGTTLKTVSARSNLECVTQCVNNKNCCVVEFKKTKNECTMKRKIDDNEETTHDLYNNPGTKSFVIG